MLNSRNRTVLIAAVVTCAFCGCSLESAVDETTGLIFNKEDNTVINIEKKVEDELPVIVMQTDDTPPVAVEEPVEEVPEEEYEYIWDNDNKIYSKEAASRDEITMCFTGDISLAEGYANMSTLANQGNGIEGCILPEVMSGLKSADILMVNNEFAYSDRGTPTAGKQYTFRAKPKSVSYLNDMEVDIVSLANNHAYDWGPDALMDTFSILTEAKIPYVGAGKNIDEAVKPVYFKINGKTIAYTSATQIERLGNPDTKEATADSPGVLRTLDATRFVSVIQEAKANSDFTVVYVHWGSENTDLVEDSQKSLAQKYADAGADLIIGDHSHCLQGIDYIDDVPVIYSLGNFWFNSKTVDTGYIYARLDADCRIKSLQFVPCLQEGCRTKLVDGDKKASILNYLQGISVHASIDGEGFITYSSENHNVQNTSPSKKKESDEPADGVYTLNPLMGIDPGEQDASTLPITLH